MSTLWGLYHKYGAFIAFFPTVLSGPIQKSRNLLPQISNPKFLNYEQCQKGTLLFIWGAFEKILVANKLQVIYNNMLENYDRQSSAQILLEVISFSLYIYADFSSYSDMARGIGKLLGIDIGKNFNNPYLSQSTSEFWNRWHISLNEWFIENVYIPLGGSRMGNLVKYRNIMIVFLISGLWHGASWHFILWGIINGILVVSGQILKPYKEKIYLKLKIDKKSESVICIKRLVVFYLITLTWIFFMSGIIDSLKILKKILIFDFLSIFDSNLLNIYGTASGTFITLIVTVIFVKLQYQRQDEKRIFQIYKKQPFFIQCFIPAVLIVICIFGACTAIDTNINTQFMYFQF